MTQETNNILVSIAIALAIAGILYIAGEVRSLRLLVTQRFAEWQVHLFGHDTRGGITGDVRALQRLNRRRRFDDVHAEDDA